MEPKQKPRQRKVFVVNKSAHDFSPALEYGDLVYMSQGPIDRYACNSMHRAFSASMRNSSKNDYIVLCSLNVMNSIACAVFAKMHGRLNLLLFKDGKYIERNLVM